MKRHGMTDSPEYRAWQGIKARCHNPRCKSFRYYGARGIAMCERWRKSFVAFLADVGLRPRKGFQLDRRDNNRGYEPGNCRWIPRHLNNRNKRNIRKIWFNGRRWLLFELAKKVGIPSTVIRHRLKSKWTITDAILRPVKRNLKQS